jgi:ribulose-phosphate 3-epimerase
VGVLTADLMELGNELKKLDGSGTKVLHFDVMDGCFCPMMTVGPPFIKQVQTDLLKDVHLMIEEPVGKLGSYVEAGADIVTVHVESTKHIHRALQYLGKLENANDPERGIIRGAALNPGTPVSILEPLLDDLEMIVLLAVNPGWGGQSFIPSTIEKVHRVKELLARYQRQDVFLCIDGGITKNNIAKIAEIGADLIVTGSAVYDGKTPYENARFMLEALHSG